MILGSIAEVEEALKPYFVVASKTTAKDITLKRTAQLMSHIGNPEKKLRVIHVAGTSGKTSTTTYIATLLNTTGKKIGHTVSPHVSSLTERVQINGQPLSDETFCEYMAEFLELIKSAPEKPTWFEVLIAFVFWVFAEKEQVDYAVMETGLGGLQDSTNVAERADKLCVITDIGLDHTHILGDRIGAIAHQKAGIIYENNVALMYEQGEEIMQVFRYWVSQQEGAELYSFTQEKLASVYTGKFIAGFADYQKRNWLLAWATYRYICRRDGMRLASESKIQANQEVIVPGRMEVKQKGDKTIIFDGAHNEQKMTALISSFAKKFPGEKPVVLLALKEGKELDKVAPLIAEVAEKIIVTSFSEVQDLPFKSIDTKTIVKAFEGLGIEVVVEQDPKEAYKVFLELTKNIGLVTGSFYLIAELHKAGAT